MRRISGLAAIAAGIGGATLSGFGHSVGRDIWKWSRKNQFAILVLVALSGAVLLPLLAGRNLLRGCDRSVVGWFFLTFIPNVLMLILGCVLAILLFDFFLAEFVSPASGFTGSVLYGVTTTAGCAAIGVAWGGLSRPQRIRSFAVAKANERFLVEIGFKETGGADITHYDPSGLALRLLETQEDKLVFMVVGKRGKRAFINLDSEGRMTSYSGLT